MATKLVTGQNHALAHLNQVYHGHRACRPSQLAIRKNSTRSSTKRCGVVAAASEESRESTSSFDEESRLEALERGVRKRQGAQSISAAQRKAERQSQVQSVPSGGMAEWKEGQLFPKGWGDMNAFQKVAELYTGKRGLLFWMGKLTYALIFIVIGGWIVFRFVLPGLGVLELQNGLDSRPNY
ncbi:g8553 [Coccomyxa viridis]|uniref:G8553 protein n=1 Tax=Coccomyxa viridis TaxID=1274662 RepID=A0ABP1G5E6_9CHLO